MRPLSTADSRRRAPWAPRLVPPLALLSACATGAPSTPDSATSGGVRQYLEH